MLSIRAGYQPRHAKIGLTEIKFNKIHLRRLIRAHSQITRSGLQRAPAGTVLRSEMVTLKEMAKILPRHAVLFVFYSCELIWEDAT